MDDTVVYAPTSGKLDINDVDVGTYAQAGSTVLVTMGSVDQVYAQFNVSEDEYLKLSSFFNSDYGQCKHYSERRHGISDYRPPRTGGPFAHDEYGHTRHQRTV